MEKKKIPAVFKEDIKKVLQSIGLLSSIEMGIVFVNTVQELLV